MKNVWHKTKVLLPYAPEEVGCFASTLSNAGKVYSIFRVWKKQQFEMCSIDENSKIEKKQLDFPKNIYPTIVKMKEDRAGNIVCSIPYEKDVTVVERGKFTVQGFLHFKCNPENEVLAHVDAMFSPDFSSQYISKKKNKARGKDGIANLKLLKMLNQADGSTILVCEQQEIRTEIYENQGKIYYDYSGIVMVKFNSDVSLAWMKKIPKRQIKGGFFADKSIKYIHSDGYHYVFYVDNPQNEIVEPDALPALYKSEKGGFLTLCKIDDATGEYERYNVLNMKDIEGKVADKFGVNRLYVVDVKEQLFMMECYIKGKRDASVRIKLK